MASIKISPRMSPSEKMLTRFPNLSSGTIESLTVKHIRTFNSASSIEDEDIIILSWATFLHRYTGNDEPTFLVDDDIVTVQVNNWTIERSRFEGSLPTTCEGTGISIQV